MSQRIWNSGEPLCGLAVKFWAWLALGVMCVTAWVAFPFELWILVPIGLFGMFFCLFILYVVVGEDDILDASLKRCFRKWILLAGPMGAVVVLSYAYWFGKKSEV